MSGGELPATQLDPLLKAVYDATQIRSRSSRQARAHHHRGGREACCRLLGHAINFDDERPQAVPVCGFAGSVVPPLGRAKNLVRQAQRA